MGVGRQRRSRIRPRIDMGRLATATARPGNDPRTWVSTARVDTDQDAIRWDTNLGWLVDVHLMGGGLDGEGPFACRVTLGYVEDGGGGMISPPTRGAVVTVKLLEGNVNAGLWITGYGNDPDAPVPSSVNGQQIDEDFAGSNHILVTQHSVQQQVGEKWRTSATSRATLEAPELRLQSEDASQAYVRGNDQATAIKNVLTSIDTFATAVVSVMTSAPFPKPALQVPVDQGQVLHQAIEAAKTAIDDALSTKIKGE